MADWTLRAVDPVALATTGLHRDGQGQQGHRQPSPRRRPAIDAPALLRRLAPGSEPGDYDLSLAFTTDGELSELVVRERSGGRIVRRLQGAAIDQLLKDGAEPGFLVERSG